MNGHVITQEVLQEATGYQRQGDIEKVLQASGIKFFPGKGGRIWTTIELINAAGGLTQIDLQKPKAEDIL